VGLPRFSSRILVIAAAALAASADAGQVVRTLAVSATVSPSAHVELEIVAQPLEITPADLERGYVDVVMKSRMRVPSVAKARPAVVMAVEPRADLFRSVTVASNADGDGHSENGRSGTGEAHSGNARSSDGHSAPSPGSSVIEANDDAQGQVAEFRYRFQFQRTAREGQYGAAISVTVEL
jgi:hypothetical protein